MIVLCDFCSKEATGYTQQQMFIFCDEHEKEAEDKFDKAWSAMEERNETTQT